MADLSDEQLAAIAYKGFDDYWTEDCAGKESEAWAASAKAVIAAAAPQAPSGQQAEPTQNALEQAARQALEALETYVTTYNDYWERGMDILEPVGDAALAALRAALAGQQSERPAPAWQAMGERIDAALAMFPVCFDGQSFRINDGPPLTADGDDVFYSKKKVLALLESLYGHLKGIEAALAASQAERTAVKEGDKL